MKKNNSLREEQEIALESLLYDLERDPNHQEIAQALADLRREKVKEATGATIKAAQFDRSQVAGEWTREKQSAATRRTYTRELGRFFSWADHEGVHVLQVRRADLIRLRNELKEKYSTNTTRLCLSAVSAFYRYMEAERYIDRNPALAIPYPRREYKKAVRPNPGETIPVMNENEYRQIIEALERQQAAGGRHISARRRRESAARLLPAVRFMALFGLRVGDLPGVRIDGDRFSYRAKGGVILRREQGESWDEATAARFLRSLQKEPFKGMKPGTLQVRLKDLTNKVAEDEQIRYSFTAHDFRHFFARQVYEKFGDIYATSRYLGHSSIATTQVYLQQIGME